MFDLRRLAFPGLVALAGFATTAASLADGPPPLHTGTPPPPVHFTDFRRPQTIGLPLAYAGGPIAVEVEITNTAKTDANGVIVSLDIPEPTPAQSINVAAGAKATVTLTDPTGLTSGCTPRHLRVKLQSPDGKSDTRVGLVTPHCKLTSSLVDPWNLAEPDRVVDQQKDTAYFDNAVLESATCAEGVKIKGRITNHSKKSSPSVIVQGSAGSQVLTQTSAAFPLAAGESKSVVLTPVAHVRPDVPDRLDLKIVDWTHSLGGSVVNQGITLKTTKSCSLTFGWGDVMAVLK